MTTSKKSKINSLSATVQQTQADAEHLSRIGTNEQDIRDIQKLIVYLVIAAIGGFFTIYLALDSRMDTVDKAVSVLQYQVNETKITPRNKQ